MNNKPYIINWKPAIYISYYSPKYGGVSNKLLCLGVFGKFKYIKLK